MEKRLTATLSLSGVFLMLALSLSFGFHNYRAAEKRIVHDLNQALRQTVLAHSTEWINPDTLQTYHRLTELFGQCVAVESSNNEFTNALHLDPLKAKSGLIVRISRPRTALTPQEETEISPSASYLTSDTIVWMPGVSSEAKAARPTVDLSFQGYARCSFLTIFSLADKSLPVVCLVLAALSGFFFVRYGRFDNEQGACTADQRIAFGNITLSCAQACFFKEDEEKLKMTPQQYTLMEMFFRSPAHLLTRSEICDALWPGKDNADETLNTLVRRLRPLIEENSNLKITTDRGRAYVLEIKETAAQTAAE